ncbi:hypothetical protein K8354_14960 [Polaribacter litorisediminis]|uniref:hypothetical protein n=1 Tax=Polaribacter litorisediminis TaxID=1908341 RepID=UPI001CC1660E|nr:hypothetical protein [Polaribacter litorisediminis]UAM97590.1 hypothetical protein K8354_14960 [Polaribacter litorisediminis]
MKKFIKILVFSLLFISCLIDEDEDVIRNGFQINLSNSTNKVYTGKYIIGGFKDNVFIVTDSIDFEREVKTGILTVPPHFTDANRWKPDLSKIRAIPSERCYFRIKLSDGRNQLITRFDSSELMSLQLPNTTHFRGDFGRLIIAIQDNQITGYAAKEE